MDPPERTGLRSGLPLNRPWKHDHEWEASIHAASQNETNTSYEIFIDHEKEDLHDRPREYCLCILKALCSTKCKEGLKHVVLVETPASTLRPEEKSQKRMCPHAYVRYMFDEVQEGGQTYYSVKSVEGEGEIKPCANLVKQYPSREWVLTNAKRAQNWRIEWHHGECFLCSNDGGKKWEADATKNLLKPTTQQYLELDALGFSCAYRPYFHYEGILEGMIEEKQVGRSVHPLDGICYLTVPNFDKMADRKWITILYHRLMGHDGREGDPESDEVHIIAGVEYGLEPIGLNEEERFTKKFGRRLKKYKYESWFLPELSDS